MTRRRIFNHDIMVCTHASVMGNYLYSGRVLGLTEPEDIIQLHPDLKSQWDSVTEHYERIGLSHSKNAIWDVSLRVLEDYPNLDVSLFFFGNATNEADCGEDWLYKIDRDFFDTVKLMNSKNNFIQLAQELGVSVPQTLCFKDKALIKDLSDFPYPCYFKPAISVNGSGIARCENPQQLCSILETFPEGVLLQIQEEVVASCFLNVQYHAQDSKLERLAITAQILNGCSHTGNRYPSPHQPWESVEPIAEWMVQHGMKEVFAFDVAVVEDATQTRYLAIECNPRFNGASYPTGIAKKLNISSWSHETFKTECCSLENLDFNDIEFNPKTNTGVVVVNWGTILVGKISILLAGTVQEQNELRTIVHNRCQYEHKNNRVFTEHPRVQESQSLQLLTTGNALSEPCTFLQS
ncbi:MAG: ATP-grasp domain-containing protein [Scytonema sp. PMC 1070.18]|nr:ATP-grasp domain-containing protein [Scytonema sp. PMC 1070.18]